MASFELPYEKVDSLVNEISIGGKIVPVETINGSKKTIFLSHCSLEENLYSSAVYDETYNKAIEEGFLTAAETEDNFIMRGIYEAVDEKKVADLKSKIEGQEKLLEKMTRVPARRERVINNIKGMKGRLSDMLNEKEVYLEYSAERKAHEERLLFLCWRGVRDPLTRELYWPTKKDFDKEKDIVFRRNAFNEHIKMSVGIDSTTLRYIARHNLWRIRYTTSVKTGISLFGVELPNYSVDQLSLAYWSYYYQSIYDMMPDEKPSDEIMEDDAALDAFMKSYMEEQGRDAATSKGKKGTKSGVKSAWDYGETIVMSSNPMYKDIPYTPTIEAARNKTEVAVRDKGKKTK